MVETAFDVELRVRGPELGAISRKASTDLRYQGDSRK